MRPFLDHYRSIGVTSFFFVYNNHAQGGELAKFFANDIDVTIAPKRSNACLGLMHWAGIKKLHTDYIINVDPDEFIDLGDCDNLAQFISKYSRSISMFKFGWHMLCNDAEGAVPLKRGFDRNEYKCLFNRRSFSGGNNNHWMRVRRGSTVVIPHSDARILHYWGRTFGDVYLKCMSYKFKNGANPKTERVVAELQDGILPPRLRALAVYCKFAPHTSMPQPALGLDQDYQNLLIERVNDEGLYELALDTYAQFKEAVTAEQFEELGRSYYGRMVKKGEL